MQHNLEFQVTATLDGMRGIPMSVLVPVPHWFDSWLALTNQQHESELLKLRNQVEELRHALKMVAPRRSFPQWIRGKK